MFRILNDILNLTDESIALNRLNKVTRGYKTSDGYRFALLKSGVVTDGDNSWRTEKDFFSEVGYLNIVQLKELELDKLKIDLRKLVKQGYSDFLF